MFGFFQTFKTILYNTIQILYLGRWVVFMKERNKGTPVGISSIIFGILGLIFYFIGLFFYSFVDNRLYGMVIGLIFGIVAIILGFIAKKKGDNYGTYGLYLGILIVIIALLTVLLTTVTSVEIGYY